MSEKTTPRNLSTILKSAKQESDIKCLTADITAELAAELIEYFNLDNRPLRKGVVQRYASEMLRGKWKLNGEPLIFGIDDDGNDVIISAQHRLYAILEVAKVLKTKADDFPEAMTTLHTVIITGVPIEAADTVDQGESRKHTDVLYRNEWANKQIPEEWSNNNARRKRWMQCLAGAARLVWLRAGGATVSSAPKFVASEMLEFLELQHEGLCDFVSAVLTASEEPGKGLRMSLPYIAALTYVASLEEDGTVNKEIKETVLDAILRVAQAAGYSAGSAEHALAGYWNQLNSTPGSKDRDLDIVGPFVKAVKAMITGEKITPKKIELSKKEKEDYKDNPPLFDGWDTAAFIAEREAKAELLEEAANAKAEREAAKEAAKAEKEAARIEREKQKVLAKLETDKVANKLPKASTAMATMGRMIKRKPKPVAKT